MARRSSGLGVRGPFALALLASLGWFVSGTALAQPSATLNLRWEAPFGCPQQSDVRDRIRKLTGSASSTAGLQQVEGTITQIDNGRFHLKLVMHAGSLVGQRDIDSKSCDDLAGAAAVTLALLMRSEQPLSERDLGAEQPINPATSNPQPANPATGEPEKPTPSDAGARAKAPASDQAERLTPTSERRFRIALEAPLAALSFGPLPQPSWGLAFAGGVSFESWRFLLQGAEWQHQNVPAQALSGYGADVDRLSVTLRACRARRFSALEIAPCLALSLEHISAQGTGAHVAPRSQGANFLGVGGGAQGRVYLARWFSVVLGVDAQIEASRPRLSIDGIGEVGQLGPAVFTVMLGPEWIF